MIKKGTFWFFRYCRHAGVGVTKKVACPLFGFSLLEVVLALAILAGALAALGEVMRLGDENASAAADETRAEMLAESVMSEILVGARRAWCSERPDAPDRRRSALDRIDRRSADRPTKSSSRSRSA